MYNSRLRPFDLMVPFWGKRYRDYFVDLCLPSLLAPNNIALLRAEDGHRFLIATTTEDWRAIENLPIMNRLRQHATPTWIEVSGPLGATDVSAYDNYQTVIIKHQNHCQKKLVEAAYQRRSYGSLLFPDVIYSDFMIASLIKLARAGYHFVLLPALRQIEEDVLDDLTRLGYLPSGARLSLTGEALAIPQRALAEMAVRHLHPEMLLFDQSKPVQPFHVPFRYWPIAGGRGLILHSFFGCIALIDFQVVSANHADCLDQGAFENVYASSNFAQSERIHIINDSDEFALVSLTPRAVNWAPPLVEALRGPWWAPELKRLRNIRETMWIYAGANRDVVRRDLFRVPIRWHSGELDRVWAKEARRIERMISCAVGDYFSVSRAPNRHRFPSRPNLLDLYAQMNGVKAFFVHRLASAKTFLRKCVDFLRKRLELVRRLWLVLRGDPAARRWLTWRIHVLRRQLQGHKTHPPRPDVP